ncbi:two-component regulator propeller domain-containing protein [uncultured Proteiniphilum sp.]|uniref:two-component regulator propeller domain-containing protein n=1 Tax=uncultured Proteiniphilum sp. TaxID=497637 RepID=UPI002626751C|nr:two-component regulator propeller domain-containing protein [uncultured Proteiniphilum sp.]
MDKNSLWIYSDIPLGTWLYNSRQKEWKHMGSKKSDFPFLSSSDMIQDIIQDPNGLIWMATDHGGIDIIDKKANIIRKKAKNKR